MSTIKRAYMELSNGIRGLRFHREQHTPPPQTSQPSAAVREVVQKAVNGPPMNSSRFLRSPKTMLTKKFKTIHTRPGPTTTEELFNDETFLSKLFTYFSPEEKGVLCQVCSRWRTILYQPKFWSNVMLGISYKELFMDGECRKLLYDSLQNRGIDAVCLFAATDDDISDFLNYPSCRKNIRSISLRFSNVSDSGLEYLLKRMVSIYRLELSGCNDITEGGLWSCLTPKIVSLSVSDCINVADDTVGAIAQLLPSLYELNLQAYHVTDSALAYFSTKQSYTISILRLQSCWEITNHGIVNIVHSLPNLTVISLSGCSKVTDDGIELIAENLRKLRSLDLSWCPRLTDASLEYIACDLSQLEELVLDRCNHVTDIGVGYLSTMTTLRKLFLRWCTQVRDFGLQHVYSMRNLRVLSLAGCSLISSSGLSGLTCLRNLEELELTNCTNATPEVFEHLREYLPTCLIIE